jgi:hypothetical protein
VDVVFVWCCVCRHPVSKIYQFFGRTYWHFNTGENAFDLHCCIHGSIMGAEKLYMRRMAKATRTGMVLTITITLALSKWKFNTKFLCSFLDFLRDFDS